MSLRHLFLGLLSVSLLFGLVQNFWTSKLTGETIGTADGYLEVRSRADVIVDVRAALISIVIPVFNGSEFIEGALRCAIGQDYLNIEVIVTIDFSHDSPASARIVQNMMQVPGSRNITLFVHNRHKGFIRNVNFGLSKARGSFVGILPCDDEISSNFYSKLHACLLANPRASNCFPRIDYWFAVWQNGTTRWTASGQSLKFKSVRGELEQRLMHVMELNTCAGFRGLVRRGENFAPLPNMGNDSGWADMVQQLQHAVAGELISVDDVAIHKRVRSDSHSQVTMREFQRKNMYYLVDMCVKMYLVSHMHMNSSLLLDSCLRTKEKWLSYLPKLVSPAWRNSFKMAVQVRMQNKIVESDNISKGRN